MLVSVKTPSPWLSWVLFSFFCLHLATFSLADQDYYEILKVPRSASTKEIRKAFKKLAVVEHPDKKTDDPLAHEKFLKITRAYEVLKDDALRKKFDLHGEEGLKEDFHGNQHYESWSFYQDEFGIYDDDPEIITLSLSDFEQSVEGTQDLWFINFYSPHCSHCHHLAPTWREMARELDGVVRIGAINCQDDWQLCRMQGIRSYPSLLLYPSKEKYYGERSKKAMVDFALSNIHAAVVKLSPSTFKQTSAEESSAPWVINVCHTDGDCMDSTSEMKVAAMLEGLVNVGSINCDKYSTLCDSLHLTSGGVYFYKIGEVQKGKETVINSLNSLEIAHEVMAMLPDVKLLGQKQFEEMRKMLKDNEGSPWMVHFVENDEPNLELRKIPRHVEYDNIQVGRVDCRQQREQCNELHLMKLPVFLIFKEGGGHEVYYGRLNAQDVAAFAKDSIAAPMRALGPQDFPDRVVESKDPWFVDFFAPWCPPCMKLLPEFRKASKSYGQKIFFGTVDCTIHTALCRDYNIRSYPTTIFYNESVPHHYHGNHFAQDIVEFIEDTLNPPVIQLTPANFETKVSDRPSNEIWVVDFFAPWCGPCQQLAPEWRKLAKMFKSNENIHVAEINCKKYRRLCQDQGVNSYPTLRLYPMASNSHLHYNGWHRDVDSLHAWVYENLPSKVTTLHVSDFQSKVMDSKTPWIIDFYASWCGHCQIFKPQFEMVAEQLDGRVQAGKIDCEQEFQLCQEYGISAYPTVKLFLRKHGGREHGIDIDSQEAVDIIDFVKSKIGNKKRIETSHDEF